MVRCRHPPEAVLAAQRAREAALRPPEMTMIENDCAFALFGLLSGGMGNALIWGLVGLVIGVVASGAVLMVLGWKGTG